MLSTSIQNRSRFASHEDVRRVFSEFGVELEWLAYFITGDHDTAAACVVDACGLSQSHNQVFEDWLLHWARYTTIRSALLTQKTRLCQLAGSYPQPACFHDKHALLSSELIELMVDESESLVSQLDVISRAALVMCGIEKHSVAEAALMLRVSSACVRAAYCLGLQCLEMLKCEQFRQDHEFAAVYN